MKQIYSARDEVDAEMAKMFLTNAGITAIIQGGGLRNIIGEIPVRRAPRRPSGCARRMSIRRWM